MTTRDELLVRTIEELRSRGRVKYALLDFPPENRKTATRVFQTLEDLDWLVHEEGDHYWRAGPRAIEVLDLKPLAESMVSRS